MVKLKHQRLGAIAACKARWWGSALKHGQVKAGRSDDGEAGGRRPLCAASQRICMEGSSRRRLCRPDVLGPVLRPGHLRPPCPCLLCVVPPLLRVPGFSWLNFVTALAVRTRTFIKCNVNYSNPTEERIGTPSSEVVASRLRISLLTVLLLIIMEVRFW